MLYPFMTLNDGTEIVHSEMYSDGTVKVCIETPDEKLGFREATCWLPMYRWENDGYTKLEMMYLRHLIVRNTDLIMEFSQTGGIMGADSY